MDGYSTDRLIAGAIVSALVTAFMVVFLVYLDFPPERNFSEIARLLVPVILSACLLFPRPVLHRTLLKTRRDPLLLDDDLNMTLVGRGVGLIGGVFAGVILLNQIL